MILTNCLIFFPARILCQSPSILYSSYILQIDKWVDQNQTDEWEVAGLKLKWEMDKSLD